MTETLTRSIEEITASARMNMKDMINRAIALGQDFIDAKEQLGHGKFLPWLNTLGVSSSTASNYMKVAREIEPGSRLADLPYSKALALLSAPADQREELAEEAEEKSAAEIRKLIEERNRAADAANAETNRANNLQTELEYEKTTNKQLLNNYNKLIDDRTKHLDEIEKLRADLLTAENNRVEVEVVPADYERLKENQAILMNAATEAEERAAAAEAELENVRMNGSMNRGSTYETLHRAMKLFFVDCELLPMKPGDFFADREKIASDVRRIEQWCRVMRESMDAMVEGACSVS